ncbi:MAG TPA: TrmH family RNA methyltransferase, partial [Thermoanaerobaculia bacterium]|nr:TrmH family RNA methyltransferase [Thermoanaerobaculia bacterium]
TRATRPVWDAGLRRGDHLLFGKETRGLPPAVLDRFPDRLLLLPMVEGERSLNLATAVCTVIYEGVRQLISTGAVSVDNGRLRIPD